MTSPTWQRVHDQLSEDGSATPRPTASPEPPVTDLRVVFEQYTKNVQFLTDDLMRSIKDYTTLRELVERYYNVPSSVRDHTLSVIARMEAESMARQQAGANLLGQAAPVDVIPTDQVVEVSPMPATSERAVQCKISRRHRNEVKPSTTEPSRRG